MLQGPGKKKGGGELGWSSESFESLFSLFEVQTKMRMATYWIHWYYLCLTALGRVQDGDVNPLQDLLL